MNVTFLYPLKHQRYDIILDPQELWGYKKNLDLVWHNFYKNRDKLNYGARSHIIDII